ncbi:acyl-CoA dehydrogenase family protein [Thermocrispum municipale]|uniref:acyl-CoA dehydrogenase family protein n=1 Tax=Thermocrispum municipale TaxID=37926 RepID=UPI0004027776|nr:acyl-CoA dehydrogenase family protein [Thermocrispum municipale]
MDTDEKALLRDSLAGIIRDTPAERLDAALTDFGWPDLLDDEPAVAVSLLFELQGKSLATTSALSAVMARAARVEEAAIVLPSPGSALPSSTATATPSGLRIDVRGMVAASADAPPHVIVPVVLDERPVLVRAAWQDSWPASGTGIDPAAEWSPVTTTLEVDEAAVVGDADAWRRLRAAGHRALAHELVGITGVMLDLAVEHVSSRTQFGRPLGSFQAVKHKLADVRLWQECAVLASDAAWEPVDDHEAATAAAIAKVTANRFAETARQHCQQVLGGMGFTWEHDFHRYLKWALLLEPVLGSTEALHAELGAQLRAGTDPRLAML